MSLAVCAIAAVANVSIVIVIAVLCRFYAMRRFCYNTSSMPRLTLKRVWAGALLPLASALQCCHQCTSHSQHTTVVATTHGGGKNMTVPMNFHKCPRNADCRICVVRHGGGNDTRWLQQQFHEFPEMLPKSVRETVEIRARKPRMPSKRLLSNLCCSPQLSLALPVLEPAQWVKKLLSLLLPSLLTLTQQHRQPMQTCGPPLRRRRPPSLRLPRP